jgi:hypothetical protein
MATLALANGPMGEEKEKSRPRQSPSRDRVVGSEPCKPFYFLSLWMSMTSPASFTSIVT